MINRRDFIRIMGMGAASTLINWQFPAPASAGKAGPGQYDAVVIGAGLGGLSCAAYLAVNGYRPLVVEKHLMPGGYATSFPRIGTDRQRYQCEVSLHATAATGPSLQKIFKDLKILDKLVLVRHPHAWSSRYPDFAMDIPSAGLAPFREMLLANFPEERKGLTDFFTCWQELMAEVERLDREGMPALKILFPALYPAMWDIRNRTLAEVLDRYLASPRLKFFLSQNWGYYGLPPASLSAFYYLIPFGEYLTYGGYYLKGTSQTLSNALVETIRSHGGEVVYNERVTEIVVGGGRAGGVRTASGKSFSARAVVSNAAVPETLAMLSRPDAMPPSYRDRIASFSTSMSSFIVWLGLDGDVTKIEKRPEVNIYPGYDNEKMYAGCRRGDPDQAGIACVIYDNLVPGFSPAGKSTVSIMFLCGYEPWQRFAPDYVAGRKEAYRQEKERVAKRLIAIVEARLIPGLSKMIVMQDAATPLTNRRFTGNTGGAIYGFDQTVDNAFMNRLEVKTPLPGLYLASAWSNPGGGYGGVLLGGKGACKSMIEDWQG